jgi:hypothetical protein
MGQPDEWRHRDLSALIVAHACAAPGYLVFRGH